jgi:hypothetical protein
MFRSALLIDSKSHLFKFLPLHISHRFDAAIISALLFGVNLEFFKGVSFPLSRPTSLVTRIHQSTKDPQSLWNHTGKHTKGRKLPR